jgi:hypothetical protein
MVTPTRKQVKNSKQTAKRLDKLERSLAKKLLSFYNSRIKPSITPVPILRQKLTADLRALIRKAVQESYLVGTETVGNTLTEKVPEFDLFISTSDVDNIAALGDRMTEQFWNTAAKLRQRDEELKLTAAGQLIPKPKFDQQAAMIGIAAAATFNAFNTAVRKKLPEVLATAKPTLVPAPPFPRGPGPPPPGASKPAVFEFNAEVPFEIRRLKLGGKVMFLTKRDAEVDKKICAPLDGKEWDADDPNIITPWVDTHPHCRCQLIPVVEPELAER